MKREQTPWAQLAKYISGDCSPHERQEVEEWIEADPAREELIRQLRRIWYSAGESTLEDSEDFVDIESEWEELSARMPSDSDSSDSDSFSSTEQDQTQEDLGGGSLGMVADMKAVATVTAVSTAVVLLVGSLFFLTEGAETGREIVAKKGEQMSLNLSDGTTVDLNADSKLRIPASFGDENRIVHMSGEAYFDVASDSSKSFKVQLEQTTVKVLGTAFGVRGYSGGEDTKVAVEEGMVSVSPTVESQKLGDETPSKRTLRPGEVGHFSGGQLTITTNVGDYTSWREGRLVFKNTPLSKVAVRLERRYGMDTEIQDQALASRKLTANLKSESIREVLDVISVSLGIQYRIDKDNILFLPRRD